MLVNKNEVIPFQKSSWNALCKNGILLKYPLFQNQILKGCFNQATQQHNFCTVNWNHSVTLLTNTEDSTEFQK